MLAPKIIFKIDCWTLSETWPLNNYKILCQGSYDSKTYGGIRGVVLDLNFNGVSPKCVSPVKEKPTKAQKNG